jgi:hypothetical protein
MKKGLKYTYQGVFAKKSGMDAHLRKIVFKSKKNDTERGNNSISNFTSKKTPHYLDEKTGLFSKKNLILH